MTWPKFKTQDEVPEAFRSFYHEKGGEWVAKELEDDRPTQADVDALKEAARKERELTTAAEKRAKELDAKLKEAERKAKAAEAGVDLDSPEVKKWRDDAYKEIRSELQTEIDGLKKSAEDAGGKARALLLDSRVKATALKVGGVRPSVIDDWWALNADHFELDDKDEPAVKDGKGKDVAAYISTDLKKARPYLYEGTKADGGGADGGARPSRGTGGMSFEEFQKLSPTDKLRVAREADAAATV
jgi:uncharacterized protein YdaU (DUF1376 family)